MGTMEAIGNGPPIEWIQAHEALCDFARKRAEFEWEEGKLLLQAQRAEVHRHFAYASFAEYVGRWFGYGYRSVEEKLRVASALESLPEIDRMLATGDLSWSAVRELTRVATAETESEWLATASGKTVRQLERLVSGRVRGDRPGDRPKPGLTRHILRFEVGSETLATFREALKQLRQRADEPLDDEAALLQMARQTLGGPRDTSRASYQISVTTCDQCSRSFQTANGDLIELDPAIAEMAHCDGEASDSEDAHVGADSVTDASTQDAAQTDRAKDDSVPNMPTTARETTLTVPREIPRAVRRGVFKRDRGCCVVPGCRNTLYVDLHHVDPRAAGGGHDPDNLIVVCGAHHGALHRGTLRVDGKVSSGLHFRHADGTSYGLAPSATMTDASARAFAALRKLGFSEKVARRALDGALATMPPPQDAESLLRAALAIVT